jgi:hypothetical protein
VKPYRDALVEDGIPVTSFAVDDCHAEYEKLCAKGVRFLQPPVDHETVVTAVLDDTCGNLIQICEKKRESQPSATPRKPAASRRCGVTSAHRHAHPVRSSA